MKAVVSMLALCLAGALPEPAAAAPGDRDRSFGRAGLVRSGIGGTDFAAGVTLLPGSRLLVFGRSDVRPPADARMSPGNEDFALARYTAAGRLDSGFGRAGRLTTDIGGHDGVTAAAMQADRKLLAGGVSDRHNAPSWLLVLARYDSSGGLDSGFGDGGRVALEVGQGYTGGPGLVRPLDDGRILMAAGVTLEPFGPSSSHLAVLRFLPDGRPDPEFGEGGRRIVPFHGGTGRIARLAADPAGRVVAFGPSSAAGGDLVVARYTPDGQLDPSFGEGGEAVLSRGNLDYPGALLVDRAGGVLVSGEVDVAGRGMHLTRLGPDGRLDSGFGSQGSVDLPFPALSLALDRSGRVLVAGDGFRLARYSTGGVRDSRFRQVAFPARFRGQPLSVAVQPSGRIVVVGSVARRASGDAYGPPPDYDFTVARFHGGDDARPPRIRLAGGRPRGCLRRAVVLRVRVHDRAFRGAFVARLDGRRRAVLRGDSGPGYGVRVPVRKLRPGPHRLVLVARDASDNRAVLRVRLRRCR